MAVLSVAILAPVEELNIPSSNGRRSGSVIAEHFFSISMCDLVNSELHYRNIQ